MLWLFLIVFIVFLAYYFFEQSHAPEKNVFVVVDVVGVRDYLGMLAFDINVTAINIGKSNASVVGIDVITIRVVSRILGKVIVTDTVEEVVARYSVLLSVPPGSFKTTTITFYKPLNVDCIYVELLVVEEGTLVTYRTRSGKVCFTATRGGVYG